MRIDSLFKAFRSPYSSDVTSVARMEARLFDADCAPRLGRYIVTGRVGRGGMGTVYSAYDPQLGRKVALKVLHSDFSSDRLLREAKALARLRHPNILTIYEVGECQSQAYIAMEFIDGQSLGELQRGERTPWRSWLHLYVNAGHGLAAAHRARLVHRDFKPDNVMVDQDGRAVVADFGLAKGSDDPSPLEGEPHERPGDLTRPGTQPGTTRYMAPEQLVGRSCDARSDQYSFCLALWEAIHGELSLEPDERGDTGAWRSLLRERRRTPGWVRRTLHRGLHPSPEARWPSMDALLAHLERDPARRLGRVALLLMVVALSVVGYLARYFHGQSSIAEIDRERNKQESARQAERMMRRNLDHWLVHSAVMENDPTIAAMILAEVIDLAGTATWRNAACNALMRPVSLAILRGHTGELRGAAFSPDGRRVATASFDHTVRVWRTDGRGDPVVLRGHTDKVTTVHFSPDGRTLISTSLDHSARVWDLEHRGAVQVLGHTGPVYFAAFGADARSLATAGGYDVWLWTANGRPDFRLTRVLEGHTDEVLHVELSPDGRSLASASMDRTVRVWPLATNDGPMVLEHASPVLRARFSPDGRRLIGAAETSPPRLWDLTRGRLLRELRSIVSSKDAVFSPDGRLIATAGEVGFAGLWDARTGDLIRQLPLKRVGTAVAFSPTGDRWAVAAEDGQIRVWRVDGGEPFELAGHRSAVFQLAFDRTGRYLLSSSYDATARVWDMEALDARSPQVLVRGSRAWVSPGAYESDYILHREGRSLRLLESATGNESYTLPAPEGPLRAYDVSPDGEHMVGVTGGRSAYLWDIAGGKAPRVLAADISQARFLAGGELLVGHWSGEVAFYGEGGHLKASARAHKREVLHFTSVLGGRYVASLGRDGRIVRWDLKDSYRWEDLSGATESRIAQFAECPETGLLAVANTRDPRISLWDIPAGVPVGTLDLDLGVPHWMALDCERKLLAISGFDGALELRSLDGRRLARRTKSPSVPHSLIFDPAHSLLLAMHREAVIVLDSSTLADITTIWKSAVGGVLRGRFLLAIDADGGLSRTDLELLLRPAGSIQDELWSSTTACPSLERWRELYSESEIAARLAAVRCELRQQRTAWPILLDGLI